MKIKDIKKIIIKKTKIKKIYLDGNEENLNIIAIGDIFTNMSHLKRQQYVYGPLTKYILKKIIHSVSIKTFTIKEWNFYKKSNIKNSNK
ncbi:BolA/IbaG family iron-sulfur metabolism protein [Buchnera aphidicola (Taiwanaphis decaspermi)]|uniref:BolA/IbaG family iron-sulfur metabolism protein n=1 Tax=Buchnera aphidicola TaxID=9 RepID=UPI0031B89797